VQVVEGRLDLKSILFYCLNKKLPIVNDIRNKSSVHESSFANNLDYDDMFDSLMTTFFFLCCPCLCDVAYAKTGFFLCSFLTVRQPTLSTYIKTHFLLRRERISTEKRENDEYFSHFCKPRQVIAN
jgi:hypothetical protein